MKLFSLELPKQHRYTPPSFIFIRQEAMKYHIARLILVLLSSNVAAAHLPRLGQEQVVISSQPEKGVGHFSEWSRETKKNFLIDWQAGKESEWTIVQGNEAGDLDSMTAALTWSYELIL